MHEYTSHWFSNHCILEHWDFVSYIPSFLPKISVFLIIVFVVTCISFIYYNFDMLYYDIIIKLQCKHKYLNKLICINTVWVWHLLILTKILNHCVMQTTWWPLTLLCVKLMDNHDHYKENGLTSMHEYHFSLFFYFYFYCLCQLYMCAT